MSVNANAASADYGKITVLQLPSDTAVAGPGPDVQPAQERPERDQRSCCRTNDRGHTVLRGNLLTLPLGERDAVRPAGLHVRGGTASYPILQFVTVAIGNKIGIGTVLRRRRLPGRSGLRRAPPGTGGNGRRRRWNGGEDGGNGGQTVDQQITTLLAQSQAAFDDAQAALDERRPGRVPGAERGGARLLNQAIALRNQQTQPTTARLRPTGSSPPRVPPLPPARSVSGSGRDRFGASAGRRI